MNKPHSKRWDDTEHRMEQVTLELMKKSDLEHITVQAICKNAHVNRSTFYAHFLSVYDLFDKLEAEMRRGIVERYETHDLEPFSIASFIPIFTHIKENRSFYNIVLKTRNTFPIKQGFGRLLNDVLRPICEKAGIMDEDEIMYYLVFFQAGFTMCLRRWVESGCKESEQELAHRIAACIPKMFIGHN